MTRSQAVTRIQRILGFRSDLSTEIIDALQDAQVELEESPELPWFLKNEALSGLSTIANVETVTLPSDFIREYEDDALWLFDTTAAASDQWTPLVKDDLQFLRAALPGTGKPEAYYLGVSSFFIKPTPDAVYTLKFIYYARDVILSTDVQNKWLQYAHDLMIGMAGKKIAAPTRDSVAYGEFEKLEQIGRARVLGDTTARNVENRRLAMGGED